MVRRMSGESVRRELGWQDVAPGGLLALAALLACGGATNEQLKARTAFDLNCPQDKIQITEIDVRTRGVTGCGKRVVYVESCDAPRESAAATCTWVLNSDSQSSGPILSPSAAA